MDNNTQPTQEPAATPTVQKPAVDTQISFDDMLKTNEYQSEFDRRLAAAQKTREENLQKEFEKTLKARNKDLAELQEKLKGFEGTDAAFKELQTKYDTESKQMQEQLKKQAYEFAVKDATNAIKFSSKAAKDYFVNKAIEKGLTMGDNGILGFDDFVNEYKTTDPDAFITETPKEPETKPAPTFTKTTEPQAQTNTNPFAFHFSGVRKKQE